MGIHTTSEALTVPGVPGVPAGPVVPACAVAVEPLVERWVVRSVSFKLAPNPDQQRRLEGLLRVQRGLYNAALEQRRSLWRERGKAISRVDQFKELTLLVPAEPDLALFGLQACRGTLWRLDRAFASFFRRVKAGERPGYPRFQSAERFDSVSYPEPVGWKLVVSPGKRDGRLRLQGVGQVRVRLHQDLPGEARTLTVHRRGGAWWATIQCRNVPVMTLPVTGREAGIDRGITVLAATSDGILYENPRHLLTAQGRLEVAQQRLSRCKRGSARRRRARHAVRILHLRVANQRKDRNHKLSRRLVNRYDRIVLEDLPIVNMTRSAAGTIEQPGTQVAQKSGLNRGILDAGWGQLEMFLSYKAADAGRTLEHVRAHHTSQTCSACETVNAKGRNRQVWHCPACAHHEHADTNAAKNILHRAGSARTPHSRE